MSTRACHVVECARLPEEARIDTVYRLLPHQADERYYEERTDRNIGWITREEQKLLRNRVIGIAGCGGMGGLLASIFFRLGVGEVRIADCENFDVSNINRQFASTRQGVGRSKAFETARMVRAVTDDGTLVVYPQGINEDTVESFLDGCHIVCDEIEFWAAGSRMLLHIAGRAAGMPIFNCNTVGFGTRLFRFEPDGFTIENLLRLSYEDACSLQERVQNKTATDEEIRQLMKAMLDGLVPELPEYCPHDATYKTVDALLERLFQENRASIIATNPPMAAGFLADHVLLELLRKSNTKRTVVEPPPVPGYLYFDAALMRASAVQRESV